MWLAKISVSIKGEEEGEEKAGFGFKTPIH